MTDTESAVDRLSARVIDLEEALDRITDWAPAIRQLAPAFDSLADMMEQARRDFDLDD